MIIDLIYKNLILDTYNILKLYGIKRKSKIIVKARILSLENIKRIKKFTATVDNSDILDISNEETIQFAKIFSKFLLLSPSLTLNCVQVGGDVKFIKAMSCLGLFRMCYHVDECITSDLIIREKLFFISDIIVTNTMPNISDLSVYFFFSDFHRYQATLDFAKSLLVVPSSEYLQRGYIILSSFDIPEPWILIKPLSDTETFINTKNLVINVSKIISVVELDTTVVFEFQKLYKNIICKDKKIQKTNRNPLEIYDKLCLQLLEEIDLLHIAYLNSDSVEVISHFFEIIRIMAYRFIIGIPRRIRNERVMKPLLNMEIFETVLLRIYSQLEYSSLELTFLTDAARYYANLDYLETSLGSYYIPILIDDTICSKLQDSYQNILQNDEVVKKILHLDDEKAFSEVNSNPENYDMDQLRQSEYDVLLNLIPRDVLGIPRGILLNGKTLLGSRISISCNIFIIPKPEVRAMKLIYTLRHEISHVKFLLNSAKSKYTIPSPETKYKGKVKSEAGLYVDHAIYGEFDLEFLPKFQKADTEIYNCIMEGNRLSVEQREVLYQPDQMSNIREEEEKIGEPYHRANLSNKAMVDKYDSDSREILCNGRGTLYFY